MEQDKVTLKDIAKYLPYGVLAWHLEWSTGGSGTTVENVTNRVSTDEIAFELRPLSQLTEEIKHDDETFVPIVELAKEYLEVEPDYKWDHYESESSNTKGIKSINYCCCQYDEHRFLITRSKLNGRFLTASTETYGESHERFRLVDVQDVLQKLYSWHFWTGDQSYFERDLLIEKPPK